MFQVQGEVLAIKVASILKIFRTQSCLMVEEIQIKKF